MRERTKLSSVCIGMLYLDEQYEIGGTLRTASPDAITRQPSLRHINALTAQAPSTEAIEVKWELAPSDVRINLVGLSVDRSRQSVHAPSGRDGGSKPGKPC